MKKYRVVTNNSTEYPYRVERKGLIFWKKVDTFGSENRAIEFIKRELTKRPAGVVVAEYTEADFLVDRLKGTQ